MNDFFKAIGRMFTIPAAIRAKLAGIPGIHTVASIVQASSIAAAQGAVAQHVSDPTLLAAINSTIESDVQAAIPIPPPPSHETLADQLANVAIGAAAQALIPASKAPAAAPVAPAAAAPTPAVGPPPAVLRTVAPHEGG